MAGEPEVSYKEFLQLSYDTQANMKILTETVNLFAESTRQRFDLQDKRIGCLEDVVRTVVPQGSKEEKAKKDGSSLPSNIKWILIIIGAIAFVAVLGAAIGVNIIDHLPKGGVIE